MLKQGLTDAGDELGGLVLREVGKQALAGDQQLTIQKVCRSGQRRRIRGVSSHIHGMGVPDAQARGGPVELLGDDGHVQADVVDAPPLAEDGARRVAAGDIEKVRAAFRAYETQHGSVARLDGQGDTDHDGLSVSLAQRRRAVVLFYPCCA